jgi:hypothetical protein
VDEQSLNIEEEVFDVLLRDLTHTIGQLSICNEDGSLLSFEVQSQRMKTINQNFSSCEPSLGLTFQALGNETYIKHLEV